MSLHRTAQVRLLPAKDRRTTAWKNGGGRTTEIVVSPSGAGFDDFDWRISMAEVEADGPFSIFSGIERTLTVVEGVMTLTVDREQSVRLTPQSAPFVFSGDAAVDAAVESGPVIDLNVMSRRGRNAHAVQRIGVESDMRLAQSSDVMILIALGNGLRVDGQALERYDAAISDQIGSAVAISADSAAEMLVVEIRGASRPAGQLL